MSCHKLNVRSYAGIYIDVAVCFEHLFMELNYIQILYNKEAYGTFEI